jgi:hypothetical protein
MIVIAKKPIDNYLERTGDKPQLLENKEYRVLSWVYYDSNIQSWIKREDDFLNPIKAEFYIKVINEEGLEHEYWNDYFLPTEEVRNIKIDRILNDTNDRRSN